MDAMENNVAPVPGEFYYSAIDNELVYVTTGKLLFGTYSFTRVNDHDTETNSILETPQGFSSKYRRVAFLKD